MFNLKSILRLSMAAMVLAVVAKKLATLPVFAQLALGPAHTEAWRMLSDFIPQAQSGLTQWQPSCQVLPKSCEPDTVRGGDLPMGFEKFHDPRRHRIAQGGGPADEDGLTLYDASANRYASSVCGVTSASNCNKTISFPSASPNGAPGANISLMYWAILPAQAVSTVSVYNSRSSIRITDPVGSQPAEFPQHVSITNDTGPCPAGDLSQATQLPSSCFYVVTLTTTNLSKYQLDNHAGLLKPGMRLILLAFHLMRKDPAGWVFSSFWWQSDIQMAKFPCPAATVSCPQSTSPWGHYAMDAVESQANPEQEIVPVFNPYLDSQFQNNRKTNCAVCHGFAARSSGPPFAPQLISPSYGAAGPITGAGQQQKLKSYFSTGSTTPTDQLWSMSQALNQPR